MRRLFRVIGGFVMACSLAGCGESAPEGGQVDFKATSSPAIDALRKQMSENIKSQNHLKPTTEPKPSAETKKPTDTKAAPTTKE
jgi:hypothetical protein